MTLPEQAAELRGLREEYLEAKGITDDLKGRLDQAEIELFERMQADNVGSIRVGPTNFVLAETQYGQIQDRAAFIEWAEANKPELLETKERKALVNEVIREHLDDGSPLPPGLGFYVKQYVSQRAS